jgi:hypothetical protein
MQLDAAEALRQSETTVVYLPLAFESEPYELDDLRRIDKSFTNRGMKGLAAIYGIERFKPAPEEAEEFIGRQTLWFERNTAPGSIMIGLTLEHFCYISSAQINLLLGGENFFPIPLGFPLDGVAVLKTPWELNYFRRDSLPLEIIVQYQKSLDHPPEMTINYMKKKKHPSIFKSMRWSLSRFRLRLMANRKFGYLDQTSCSFVPSRMRSRKIKSGCKYFEIEELKRLSKNSQLFYYPLQFEPEMSILAYSPYYRDQIETVRLVSEATNLGDWVVLKENPKMHGKRSVSFYDSINQFPNVIWANPNCNSRDLIRLSSKVVTISGTAALEAAAMGRSSLIFGHPPTASLLLQPPLSEKSIFYLKEDLYRLVVSKDILEHLTDKWNYFSKCLLIGNYIPVNNGEKVTTQNTEKLVDNFFNDVIRSF